MVSWIRAALDIKVYTLRLVGHVPGIWRVNSWALVGKKGLTSKQRQTLKNFGIHVLKCAGALTDLSNKRPTLYMANG